MAPYSPGPSLLSDSSGPGNKIDKERLGSLDRDLEEDDSEAERVWDRIRQDPEGLL